MSDLKELFLMLAENPKDKDINKAFYRRCTPQACFKLLGENWELEAKVKELESALSEAFALSHDMIELNVSNYDHDLVCRLNTESVELHEFLKWSHDKLLTTKGISDE